MMTIGSHFEALRAHTNLVVTISEEKQLFTENLKLIMLRVNAATSLLKWARDEGNPAIRSMVEKFYNITLMSATVQRQYAEQCFGFSKSLESILQVEQGLDAIRKQRNSSKEKLDSIQKQIDTNKRKSDLVKVKQLQEELIKHTSDEEELAAELQVKFVKGEIFKMKVLKTAFEELTTANSENAEKTKKMCTACTTVIDDHPDVPTFLGSSDVAEEEENSESTKAVSALATALGLSEKISSPNSFLIPPKADKSPSPTPAAHLRATKKAIPEEGKAIFDEKPVALRNPVESRSNQESKVKNRLSKLPAALAANFHKPRLKAIKGKGKKSIESDDEVDNFVIIQEMNSAAPSTRPAAPYQGIRRRSKSSIELGANRQLHEHPVGIGDRIRNSNEEDDDENEYECPDYIMPNSYSDKGSHLARWTSDDAISKVSLPEYSEPVDSYGTLWTATEGQAPSDPIYDSPYEIPYDIYKVPQLLMVPKKPLPETPVTNPPPKPKRSDVSEAIYINTNDVEKLLNEIYEDSKLTEEVKPEVKKRALKKIRQERMEESKSIVDRQASVIDLTANLASDQGSTEIAHRSPSNEDFTQSKSPHAVEEVEELTQPPQSKRPPLKVPPKVPARHHHKSESSEICARDNSSQPTQLTTGGATPQPQAKKNEEKITKPKVPPRPAHPS